MQEDSNVVYIAKIKGTAYEMGEAYGQLFKDYLPQQFANVATLYPGTIHDLLLDFGVPAYIVAALTEDMKVTIMNLALDINWEIAAPYLPQRYIDEMRGIADGSGVDYMTIRRANMLPELTQAHCTVLGVWGKASQDGTVLHLRALDWDAYAPINQYPTVIIYEPTEAGSKSFANIGYLGLIGTLTAMSKIGISAGEKVMITDDSRVPPHFYPKGNPEITYVGKPWMMVLRDGV